MVLGYNRVIACYVLCATYRFYSAGPELYMCVSTCVIRVTRVCKCVCYTCYTCVKSCVSTHLNDKCLTRA